MSSPDKKFSWPKQPETQEEFEKLMSAIDKALEEKGLKPWQRPLHIGFMLWEAFKWGGLAIPPEALASLDGFEGDILMAKAQKWYKEVYEDNLNSDWAFGYAPIKIRNSIWRIRAGVFYGSVEFFVDRNLANKGKKISTSRANEPASSNILCDIDGFTQGLADRLSDEELENILNFYVALLESMMWRDSLPRTQLFKIAIADYDDSTSSLIAKNFEQSIWASQQSVEKLIKGLLDQAGKKYEKGRKGHDLIELGNTLEKELNIKISKTLLGLVNYSPNIRYGEEPITEAKALQANNSVLGIMQEIARATLKPKQ